MLVKIDKINRTTSPLINKRAANEGNGAILLKGDIHLATEDLIACLAKIQEQDEEALSQFYDLTINSVYGLALSITGKAEEAEEVVSDVYFQLWDQASRYNNKKGSIWHGFNHLPNQSYRPYTQTPTIQSRN